MTLSSTLHCNLLTSQLFSSFSLSLSDKLSLLWPLCARIKCNRNVVLFMLFFKSIVRYRKNVQWKTPHAQCAQWEMVEREKRERMMWGGVEVDAPAEDRWEKWNKLIGIDECDLFADVVCPLLFCQQSAVDACPKFCLPGYSLSQLSWIPPPFIRFISSSCSFYLFSFFFLSTFLLFFRCHFSFSGKGISSIFVMISDASIRAQWHFGVQRVRIVQDKKEGLFSTTVSLLGWFSISFPVSHKSRKKNHNDPANMGTAFLNSYQ